MLIALAESRQDLLSTWGFVSAQMILEFLARLIAFIGEGFLEGGA